MRTGIEHRCLDWWQELTDGFRKGRLVIEKEEQSLPKVKRWVKHSVAPMLAVICAHHPDGQAWLEKQIVAAVGRWKTKHRALVNRLQRKRTKSIEVDNCSPAGTLAHHSGG